MTTIESKKQALAQRLGAIERSTIEEARSAAKVLDQRKVNAAFREFIDKPIPDLGYVTLLGESCIVEIFGYEEKSSILLNAHGNETATQRNVFSIGKVLLASKESIYATGDFVKLRDYDTSTIPNPRYEAWVDNPHTKSNMERVGDSPKEMMNNLWQAHGSKIFRLNPLKQELSDSDWLTFKFADAHIECKIDAHALLSL